MSSNDHVGGHAFVRAVILKREEVADFDVYPFSIPAVHQLEELALDVPVTLLAGENGSGKSTLIEALAVALGFNAEGGTRNMTVATRPSHSQLGQYLRVVRGTRSPGDGFFLRAESSNSMALQVAGESLTRTAGARCTSNRTASRSSRSSSTGLARTASTCSTNPKRLSHCGASWR
jgi:predicted ATPase